MRAAIRKDINWKSPESTEVGVVYSLFEKWGGVFEETEFQKRYKINIDQECLDILEERLDQHFSNGYDKPELVGILRATAEDENPPGARDLRSSDQTPSEVPYKNNFGSLANAYWHAGLEPTQNTYDEDILVEEFLRELHRSNEDRDIHIETPNIGDGDMPDLRVYNNNFENPSELIEESHTGLIKEIEEELAHWNEITNSKIEIETDTNRKSLIDLAQFAEIDETDLMAIYPALEARVPKLESREEVWRK